METNAANIVEKDRDSEVDKIKDEIVTNSHETQIQDNESLDIVKIKADLVKILGEMDKLDPKFRGGRDDVRLRPGTTQPVETHSSFVVSCYSSDVNDTKD